MNISIDLLKKLYQLGYNDGWNTVTDCEFGGNSEILGVESAIQSIIKEANENSKKCLVVTCIPCDTPYPNEESPNGCCNCGMMDWLCFDTEEEANFAYMKQYPEQFDENGKFIKI